MIIVSEARRATMVSTVAEQVLAYSGMLGRSGY
jgi:hypothetical protein